MLSGRNSTVYPGYGSKHDIKMTLRDYIEFTETVRQDDLSNLTLIKFKQLYIANGSAFFAQLMACTIPAYAAYRWFRGPLKRRSGDLKVMFPIFSITYFGTLWFLSGIQKPRRLYTELLTDESSDGQTLRRNLKDQKPNLWKSISAQMTTLGYKFPEMVEYDKTSIPATLL